MEEAEELETHEDYVDFVLSEELYLLQGPRLTVFCVVDRDGQVGCQVKHEVLTYVTRDQLPYVSFKDRVVEAGGTLAILRVGKLATFSLLTWLELARPE